MSVKREWTRQPTSSKEGTFWTGTMCSFQDFHFIESKLKGVKKGMLSTDVRLHDICSSHIIF